MPRKSARDKAWAILRGKGFCVTVGDLRKALEGVDDDLVLGSHRSGFYSVGMKIGYQEVAKVGRGRNQEVVNAKDPMWDKWESKGEPFKIVEFSND